MKPTLPLYLLLLSVFLSCTTEKSVIRFYNRNSDDVLRITKLSDSLMQKYSVEKVLIRRRAEFVRVDKSGPYKNATYSLKNGKIETHYNYAKELSLADIAHFEALISDTLFTEMLYLFDKISPEAVSIQQNGVFVALGNALERPHGPDVEGGLFIYYPQAYISDSFIRKIDDKVYVAQSSIP